MKKYRYFDGLLFCVFFGKYSIFIQLHNFCNEETIIINGFRFITPIVIRQHPMQRYSGVKRVSAIRKNGKVVKIATETLKQ